MDRSDCHPLGGRAQQAIQNCRRPDSQSTQTLRRKTQKMIQSVDTSRSRPLVVRFRYSDQCTGPVQGPIGAVID